ISDVPGSIRGAGVPIEAGRISVSSGVICIVASLRWYASCSCLRRASLGCLRAGRLCADGVWVAAWGVGDGWSAVAHQCFGA
ncbi:MAG TPA: hypothetical protein VF897_06990, partial [Roseiflexaceae bacterium]